MGQGPVVLMLHGTGSAGASFRGLAPRLATGFTVLCPDLPGHAFSQRGPEGTLSLNGMSRALWSLLDALALRPHAIVGHSAGAAVAAAMALERPQHGTCRVVGLNPAWLPLPGPGGWLLSPLAQLAHWNPASAWLVSRWAQRPGVVRQLLASTGSTLSDEIVAFYERLLRHAGHVHSVLTMMAAWQLKGLASRLHLLPGPVYVITGGQDRTVPPQLSAPLLTRRPATQQTTVPHWGHLAHEEDPAGMAALLMERLG